MPVRLVFILFLGPNGIPDSNPEAIFVGSPFDGTKNAATALGNAYEDITGVVTYQYAFNSECSIDLLKLVQIRLLLCPAFHSSENNLLPRFFRAPFNHQTIKRAARDYHR
jgi:hypothetical protein